jgi:hypothetical protein
MTPRRLGRKWLLGAVLLGAVCLMWAPALIAIPYTRGPGGVHDVWERPDQGWDFIFDAITESRNAQLGTSQAALQRAQELWAGPPASAMSVTLTWTGGPFVVPVPAGGKRPARNNTRARPTSALEWIVDGHVKGGPTQMIGMLDYTHGRLVWDIRNRVSVPS